MRMTENSPQHIKPERFISTENSNRLDRLAERTGMSIDDVLTEALELYEQLLKFISIDLK